jgi:uncharacterized membrane protein YvbJ
VYCKNCATQITEGSQFCQKCGAAASGNTMQAVTADASNFGMIAFILSIVGLIVGGIILGIIAIILGAIGLSKPNEKSRGLATAAIVIGIIDFVAAIIIIAVVGSMLPF